MKKIIALVFSAIILAGLFTGCGKKDEVLVLNVYNWGEYISDGSEGSLDVNKEFEKYYYNSFGQKVKVNYTTYASNEDMYNKISSGATSYDVIVPSDYMIARMIKEDMLLKLDFENIPNFKYIDDQYKNAYYDPKSEYSVPYFCGYVGIIYNTTMIDGEIDDWDCMWDEANKGKILQFNNPRDAFGTAFYYKGYDVNSYNKEVWEEAKELLKEQKPYVQSYVMDEVFNKMKNGSAAIAPYYVGDFLTMYEDNQDLAVVYPKSQTNIFVDAMCVPKVARNKELAEAYINFCLTEQISVANAEYVYYASPNILVKDNEEYIEYMSDVHEDAVEILYPTEGINATYYQNLSPEMLSYMNSLWEELKIENSVGAWVYIFAGLIVGVLLLLAIINMIKKNINSKYY